MKANKEKIVKRKKISVVLALAGILLIPAIIMPVSAEEPELPEPDNEGDIIWADAGRIPGVSGWDHSQLHVGSSSCIEADPHTEKWPSPWNHTLPSLIPNWKLKELEDDYGRVEYTDINETYYEYKEAEPKPGDKGHVAMGYGEVGTQQINRDKAVDFVEEQENDSRKFDLISYWKWNTKQIDEDDAAIPERGRKYYCSELVWASYAYEEVGIDLDPDLFKVTPQELYDEIDDDSNDHEIYWQYRQPI